MSQVMKHIGSLLAAILIVTALLSPSAALAATPLRVGVVDSETTFVNFAQLGWWTERPPRTAQVLSDAGYTVVTARDADLENRSFLDSIDVLVLPLTRVMSATASTLVKDWVEQGGSLLGVFVSPRMLPRDGCVWTSAQHPRTLSDPQKYWTCPTPSNSDGGFLFWVREMNSAVYEYGPLSEAYQTIFINDPTPRRFSVLNDSSTHPIIQNAMSHLGVSGIRFDRPTGAGAEFGRIFNSNATSILRFSIPAGTGSAEGVDTSQYDGYTAAQATRFGKGRIVFFDFDLLDFLPELNAANAAQTYQGVTQGAIAREILIQSINWAAATDGSTAPIDRRARTWAEVDVYNSGIYMRHYVKAIGNVGIVGDLHARIFDPSGKLVYENTKSKIGVYPGGPDLRYSLPSYTPAGGLSASGSYRIEVYYIYSYPGMDNLYLESVEVVKNQGKGIVTSPAPLGDLPDRIAGPDRYSTAAAISAATFDPGVRVAYVATGVNFPDALAGTAAAQGEGPVLLVTPTGIPSATASELKRLRPGRIVILGGTGAVSSGVASSLRGYTSGSVTRLSGPDRYSTAAAISAATFDPGVPVAYVATGSNFPDALAAGPVAALNGGPILLVGTDVPSATASELKRLRPAQIVVLGGTGVVSSAVEGNLRALAVGTVKRIAGSDRYSTGSAISASFFAPGVPVVYVATGTSFPDALSGGAAAAFSNAPVLLVLPNSVPSATATEITRLKPARIVVLGGVGAVSDGVRVDLSLLMGG
jgi:putative cell wall-binding protein